MPLPPSDSPAARHGSAVDREPGIAGTPGPLSVPAPRAVLSAEQASSLRRAHEERADALTAGHRERRRRGEKHPVEDFLFTYYPFSPARLRRWHPGWDVAYDARADPGADEGTVGDVHDGVRSWYADQHADRGVDRCVDRGVDRRVDLDRGAPILRRADAGRYLDERADALGFMARLLRSSSLRERRPNFACFGLHEWAMVYRLPEGAQRHEDLPLRLGREETDAVVERERLVCSHVDAFRFFTQDAVPRNSMTPTRDTQVRRDNPACLHVGMDLYKWAMKLVPLVPSDLVLDCFEHARATRVLDMEASPYDVRPLGYGVVPIETADGKAEYQRRQQELAARADVLRERTLACIEPLAALRPAAG